MNTVVNVKTQKEWDFVSDKAEIEWTNAQFDRFKENSCICVTTKTYDNIRFYDKDEVISFDHWLYDNKYLYDWEVFQELNTVCISKPKYYIAKQDYACGVKKGLKGKLVLNHWVDFGNAVIIPVECCEEYVPPRPSDVFSKEFGLLANLEDTVKFNKLFSLNETEL